MPLTRFIYQGERQQEEKETEREREELQTVAHLFDFREIRRRRHGVLTRWCLALGTLACLAWCLAIRCASLEPL